LELLRSEVPKGREREQGATRSRARQEAIRTTADQPEHDARLDGHEELVGAFLGHCMDQLYDQGAQWAVRDGVRLGDRALRLF